MRLDLAKRPFSFSLSRRTNKGSFKRPFFGFYGKGAIGNLIPGHRTEYSRANLGKQGGEGTSRETSPEIRTSAFSANRVAHCGALRGRARTALGTDRRRAKPEGRPEGGFLHEGQLPGLLVRRVTAPVALRVVIGRGRLR